MLQQNGIKAGAPFFNAAECCCNGIGGPTVTTLKSVLFYAAGSQNI